MRNILLASLLATTAGSVNAQSSVTLFGIVGGGVRWTDGVKGGHQIGLDNNIVSGNSFGMLGTEDLGEDCVRSSSSRAVSVQAPGIS